MGAYLNKPIIEKEHDEGTGNGFKYGCTSMQGWRANQEDAHNCVVDLHDGWHLFAVYDGHGGSEVSQFTAAKFPEFLKERKFWEETKLEECLQNAFVDFDDFIRSEPSMKELQRMANKDSEKREDDSEDEADRIETIEESAIPIKELIRRYGANPNGLGARTLLSAFLKEDVSDEESEEDEDEEENEDGTEDTVNSTGSGDHSNDAVKKKTKKRGSKSPVQMCAKKSKSDEKEAQNGDNCVKEEGATDGEVTSTVSETASRSAGSSADEVKPVGDTDDDDEDFVADEEDEDEEDEEEEEDDEDQYNRLLMSGTGEIPGEDSGTTACICLVGNKKIIVANAGDSRAVLCRSGKAIDLSIDHKPEDEIETKRIHSAGGVIEDGRVNGGLNLSRALGDHSYKKTDTLALKDQMITAFPDVKMEDLTDQDEFLIVACDGIWNSMDSQEVVDFVKKGLGEGKSCTEICDALCDSCLADSTDGDGTGCDNMTVICTQFVH